MAGSHANRPLRVFGFLNLWPIPGDVPTKSEPPREVVTLLSPTEGVPELFKLVRARPLRPQLFLSVDLVEMISTRMLTKLVNFDLLLITSRATCFRVCPATWDGHPRCCLLHAEMRS